MSIKAGLVGLPNVGKSTLFNALTKSSVPAENYPFCTIDPHVAITEVPDPRLDELQKLYSSQKKIPTTATFVDIAGLVKGAASGEGLGNQFLSHIREVDLILHVLRCFEDGKVINTNDLVDPINDYEIILTELMLKDYETVKKQLEKMPRLLKAAATKPTEKLELEAQKTLLEQLENALNNVDIQKVQQLVNANPTVTTDLLSAKKFLIIANIAEHELENDAYLQNKHYQALVNHFSKDLVIPISAKIEGELAQLSHEEAQELMGLVGMKKSGLDTIIQKSYIHLGLISFFTCGPKEAHGWSLKKGSTVRKAAGEIHSDLERGFICAEVFNCQDLFATKSLNALKDTGKIRTEGKDYIVQDGDILLVRFNV